MDDFTTTDGCRVYIETELIPQMVRQLNATGRVDPLGVVMATRTGSGDVLPEPRMIVSGPGRIQDEKRATLLVRTQARLNFAACGGAGVLMAQRVNRKLIFQLESATLGDLVWDSTLTFATGNDGEPTPRNQTAGPLRGARSPEDAGLAKTRIRPGRWMN